MSEALHDRCHRLAAELREAADFKSRCLSMDPRTGDPGKHEIRDAQAEALAELSAIVAKLCWGK